MYRHVFWSVCAAAAIAMPLSTASAADAPKLEHSKVLEGLALPWDMAFLPDGTMFFTEKCKAFRFGSHQAT